ncbi:PspC domain-containing protein [Pedobacter sp. BS3]|uniref:PspC domain-containing protein n=1 Tax=Pedobacter sp. BS3 TaxID=2567937 RepID=UPI001659D1A3|nr:PspC domain-containing protein [Pedobacter sp. BS3]
MEKKLQRDENNKMIAGVAAGLGEYFDIDPTWIRLAFVITTLAGLLGFWIYIAMWIVVPVRPYTPFTGQKTAETQPNLPNKPSKGRVIGGCILIFLGLYFLTDQFDILPFWFTFEKLWPLVLIIPGIIILLKAGKNNGSKPIN